MRDLSNAIARGIFLGLALFALALLATCSHGCGRVIDAVPRFPSR